MSSENIGDNQSIVFFRSAAKVLKIFGLWKNYDLGAKNKKRSITGAVVLIICGFVLTACGFSGYLDLKLNGDMTEIYKALILSLGIFLGSIKIYSIWSSVGEIKQCLEWLQEFSRCFDIQAFIKDALRLYRICFIIGMIFVGLTTITFLSLPLMENERKLPLATKNAVQIVDILQSPIYEMFYFYQTISTIVLVICIVTCDTLFCGILLLIAAFFKTINAIFEETFLNGSENKMTDKEKENVMILIIERFIEITRIINFVEDTFSLVSISNFLFNITLTGFALYITTLVPFNSPLFWFMGLGLLFEIFQLGIYCFFGEAIVTQNSIFRYNIYQCDWCNQSKLFKIMILLTLQRTEREPFILAGKLVPLCNETFTEILKMAYSICTFMYSFKGDNQV